MLRFDCAGLASAGTARLATMAAAVAAVMAAATGEGMTTTGAPCGVALRCTVRCYALLRSAFRRRAPCFEEAAE